MDSFFIFALVLVAAFLLFGALIILIATKSPPHTPTKHQIDEALGIVELPTIRISNTLYEQLVKESNSRGLVVQAIVREAIMEKFLVDKTSEGGTL